MQKRKHNGSKGQNGANTRKQLKQTVGNILYTIFDAVQSRSLSKQDAAIAVRYCAYDEVIQQQPA